MPLPLLVIAILVSLGCIAFLTNSVRTVLRRKRNLRHWERDEPLEKVGDWD